MRPSSASRTSTYLSSSSHEGDIMIFKTVVVLNERYPDEPAVFMTAIGHVAQSLGRQMAEHGAARFVDYIEAGGSHLPSISWWPFVVLQGVPGRMWALFDACEH